GVAQQDEVARTRRRQVARLDQLARVAREDVARLAERTRDRERRDRPRLRARDLDAVVRAVHRRPHEIAEAGVDHDEALAATLLVAARLLDVGDAGDERPRRRDEEAAGLDLDPDVASGAL